MTAKIVRSTPRCCEKIGTMFCRVPNEPHTFGAMKVSNARAQMRKGVLELCVLRVLSKGEAYASDVLATLQEADLIVVEGTLYALLTRMKNAGLLAYRWEESKSGPPRKYYELTPAGKEFLHAVNDEWTRFVRAVDALPTSEAPES